MRRHRTHYDVTVMIVEIGGCRLMMVRIEYVQGVCMALIFQTVMPHTLGLYMYIHTQFILVYYMDTLTYHVYITSVISYHPCRNE